MKKLLVSLSLTLSIILSSIIPVFANDIEQYSNEDINIIDKTQMTTLDGKPNKTLDDMLRYIPCSGGGKHKMVGKGPCRGYNGSEKDDPPVLFNGGLVTQCTQCKQALATQISPYYNNRNPLMVGWYTMVTPPDYRDLPVTFHYVFANDWTYNSNFRGDRFFDSFEFIL